jgi:hypothetical protein
MVGTMAVYNRASYFPERKAAMDRWGRKLEQLDPLVSIQSLAPANSRRARQDRPQATIRPRRWAVPQVRPPLYC